ncbi:hypothetical protein SCHPADRAFT_909657 [Schizopora paradoxa]|uniref:F-box domain-containing protein n=1 Tax=Schizopora paradoxa TaxID=27342 RepID=A0A0H2R5Y6_9AGAM|nr:hypothetical protein SCHPADRAFT_909657 [Schizopora paradoxa]
MSIDLKNAKIALRQMKDARSLLFSISESLDDAIQVVSKAITIDCRSTGLSLLPDDVLTSIFEMYIEMSVTAGGFVYPTVSPHVLASVCRRFRQIVLTCPGLWKHVSLEFSKMRLLSLKDRCPAPIIHVGAAYELSRMNLDNFPFIHPCQQWREFRLIYVNDEIGHLYFESLKSLIQTPLEALERLSISNELDVFENEEQMGPFSIYLDGDDLRTLSSWQMPNLTRLELRNIIPMAPLQCGNVTAFDLHVQDYQVEVLSMAAFRKLLLSMPKVQSLSIALDVSASFDTSPDTRLSLPSLRSLELQIHGNTTPSLTTSQIMGLLNTEDLTRLVFRLIGDYGSEGLLLEGFVFAVVAPTFGPHHEGRPTSFVRVEDFSLEVQHFRCRHGSLDRLFDAMPKVQNVSLKLARADAFIPYIFHHIKRGGMLGHLRSLRVALPRGCLDDFIDQAWNFEGFFGDGRCMDLEVLELEFIQTCNTESLRTRLCNFFGEKLCWIEN